MGTRLTAAFQHFDQAELRFCRYLNRPSGSAMVRAFFRGVSRLGDGWLWYVLVAVQPLLHGAKGWLVTAHLAATGGVGMLAYKLIKQHAVRERPYIRHAAISCAAAPLSAYALLVALSRVVLGLHYPTDVVAGALLAGGLALASLQVAPSFNF
ncbi:MAG: phosphatase PAP2 family protein [Steroidobacteraceae bacterium]